jgi:hypothetical protein
MAPWAADVATLEMLFCKMTTVFWNVAPCNLVETDRRFRSAYCLRYQESHRGISRFFHYQKIETE